MRIYIYLVIVLVNYKNIMKTEIIMNLIIINTIISTSVIVLLSRGNGVQKLKKAMFIL